MIARYWWNVIVAVSVLNSSACGTRTALGGRESLSRDAALPEHEAPHDGAASTLAFESDAGPAPITRTLLPYATAPDRCIELPLGAPPVDIKVSFVGRILDADIHFLIDVTGSMGDEIEEVRSRLRDTIIPDIAAQIPDVRFSVSHFADFPVTPFGSPGVSGTLRDELYRSLQATTNDIDAVQGAMDRIRLQSGGDVPEAIVEALYITATGETDEALMPPANCALGTVGYPCFASSGARIVLLFTDAQSHNGPGDTDAYDTRLAYTNHRYEDAVEALNAIGAKVLGLYSGLGSDSGLTQLQRLARDTGAVRSDGTPIVLQIGVGARSLSRDVVEAVRSLVNDVPLDVDVVLEDAPGDDFDATDFVQAVLAIEAIPPNGAVNAHHHFEAVRPGTQISFRLVLANRAIEAAEFPTRLRFAVVLRGDAITRLRETVIDVVIPSLAGVGCR